MNTKTFAQRARNILLKGVHNKLHYWGFDARGQVQEEPQPVSGGYLFRGQAYDDAGVPARWKSLRQAVQRKGIDTVAEEAAYTWFNRMMAMRILAKNGYDPAQLAFAEGAGRTPLILQRAQRGTYPFLHDAEKARLQPILNDYTRETEAFAILLIGYCHHHTLLHTVFGDIDDYTELLLPDDILAEKGFLDLLNTTDAISDADYQKVELIGWLYQFYISEKKDEVFAGFKKNKKAEAKDIPAATQIFTPNWIVKYMVQNTVGKIWLDLHPASPLKADMKYLVEPGEAAPREEGKKALISQIEQLKLLDPAVGSGHILVEGFDLLYDMYMAEYYPREEALESILTHNLFGLDIDRRAVQLAQFAVLLKAAARHPDVLRKGLRPHIYAMPEPRPFSRQDVMDFLGQDGLAYTDQLLDALQLMQQAQNLGSIMQFDLPEEAVDFIRRRWAHFQQATDLDFHAKALLPALRAYLPVLLVLCDRYEAIVANPPYMGQGNMNGELKNYVNTHYPLSKADLFAVFMEVCMGLNMNRGLLGMINQQTWMFKKTYEPLRRYLLSNFTIQNMIHLGPRAFAEMSGEKIQSTSFIIKNSYNAGAKGQYHKLIESKKPWVKESLFLKNENVYSGIVQSELLNVPEAQIIYWASSKILNIFNHSYALRNVAEPRKGITTGDDSRFVRKWTEVSSRRINFLAKHGEKNPGKWFPVVRGGGFRKWYGSIDMVIDWEEDGIRIKNFKDSLGKLKSVPRNLSYNFLNGITWNDVGSGAFSAKETGSGKLMQAVGPKIFNTFNQQVLLGLLNSKVSFHIFQLISPGLKFEVGIVGNFPILKNLIDQSNIPSKPIIENVFLSQKDWDAHETSWDFQQSPLLNNQPTLPEAYASWEESVTRDFFQLHANEEELNRIFIGIYELEDELTPDVPLKDITILQEELDGKDLEALEPAFRTGAQAPVPLPIKREVVMQQFISYLIGLCMGRYRLDKPGLHIAHPGPTAEEIAPYTYNGRSVEIDEDAILPLMGTACAFPDDALTRIKELLDTVWGPDTRTENLNFMQECLGQDLEKYLVKQCWNDHCRRYKKKPIYWLFSSPKGAFQVLVYMHRMNAFTAERIRDKYLQPHIRHLEGQVQLLANRSAQLSTQEARHLDRLRKDLEECRQYELLLKDVADRQISFDLDDGVKENYKLFEGVVAKIK